MPTIVETLQGLACLLEADMPGSKTVPSWWNPKADAKRIPMAPPLARGDDPEASDAPPTKAPSMAAQAPGKLPWSDIGDADPRKRIDLDQLAKRLTQMQQILAKDIEDLGGPEAVDPVISRIKQIKDKSAPSRGDMLGVAMDLRRAGADLDTELKVMGRAVAHAQQLKAAVEKRVDRAVTRVERRQPKALGAKAPEAATPGSPAPAFHMSTTKPTLTPPAPKRPEATRASIRRPRVGAAIPRDEPTA